MNFGINYFKDEFNRCTKLNINNYKTNRQVVIKTHDS